MSLLVATVRRATGDMITAPWALPSMTGPRGSSLMSTVTRRACGNWRAATSAISVPPLTTIDTPALLKSATAPNVPARLRLPTRLMAPMDVGSV